MLTDEWIKQTAQKQFEEVDPDTFISCMEEISAFAHAIEAAACADRDARIAELEQRNSDLHEDVQRFKEHALNEKAERLELDRQLDEARKDAQIIRNQAIEDAAAQCDDESLQAVTAWKLAYHPQDQGREIGADNCAAAIRSMKKETL